MPRERAEIAKNHALDPKTRRAAHETNVCRALVGSHAVAAREHNRARRGHPKLAIGQRGNWENAAPELGQKAGFFAKHGLTLELLYTQGAGETLQAVISGSVDIGI